jgi:SAM-dependent methyltransferase
MANFQEQFYDENVDYKVGSPHLQHLNLRERLVGILSEGFRSVVSAGLPPDVIEIGAGHGGFTEPILAAGGHVTAIEMSAPSVATLERKFGANPHFRAIYEPTGALPETDRFSLASCIAVLHHIPDYLAFVEQLVEVVRPGGSLITLQDPMWYPRRRGAHRIDRAAFLAWRIRQGNLRQGLATQARRVRGVYNEEKPGDMVEYHVVRSGVDEEALEQLLVPLFERVEIFSYWSHQSSLTQRAGERLRLRNSFGLVAHCRR